MNNEILINYKISIFYSYYNKILKIYILNVIITEARLEKWYAY